MTTSLQASTDVRALWTVCQTVRGASHKRQGKVCQDSSCKGGGADEAWRIAVVSDGHGDPSCMRSDRGSRLATSVAYDCLREFAEAASMEWVRVESPYENLLVPARQAMVIRRITDAIVTRWRRAVLKDLSDEPLTEDELSQADKALADSYRRGECLEHIYGATLVGALWMEDVLVLLQQGDGVCLVMHEDGSFEEPVPEDPNCFDNVTSSLCDADVADAIRYSVFLTRDDPIQACLLATDGVANSVSGEEGIVCFAKEILRDLSEARDIESFEAQFPEKLDSLSENGNGDDVSAALIVDVNAAHRLSERFAQDLDAWHSRVLAAALKEKLVSMERKHMILAERAEDALDERARLESELGGLNKMRDKVRRLEKQYDLLGALEAEMNMWASNHGDKHNLSDWLPQDKWTVIEDLFPGGCASPSEVAKTTDMIEHQLKREAASADQLDQQIQITESRLRQLDRSGIDEYIAYDDMRQELLDELAEIEADDADMLSYVSGSDEHLEK